MSQHFLAKQTSKCDASQPAEIVTSVHLPFLVHDATAQTPGAEPQTRFMQGIFDNMLQQRTQALQTIQGQYSLIMNGTKEGTRWAQPAPSASSQSSVPLS